MAQQLEANEIFWTAYEPKVAFRFQMLIDGIPAYVIHAANAPQISFDEVLVEHINLRRKLKGKVTWNDITITLYDPIVPSASQAVMEWIRLSHEASTGRDGYSDFYKKDLDFIPLGPVGDIVSKWIIKGAWIGESNFGEYDWGNTSEAAKITCTLKYDWADLTF